MKELETRNQPDHQQLFMTMAQGVVYQDHTGQIIAANPAAEKLLGLSVAQMQGRKSVDPRWKAIRKDGSMFPGEEHPAMVALSTGQAVSREVMGVYHPLHESYVWIQISAEPEFRPGEDKPYRVYTTFTDITDQILAEQELQYKIRLNEILLSISTDYINLPFSKIEGSINHSLEQIGEFVEADRAYIIEYDWENEDCSNTYEWCAQGIEPYIDHLQHVPISDLPEWVTTHKAGKTMYVEDVAALEDGSHLKDLLAPQGIQSLIAVPLMDSGQCIAFIGFDSVRRIHVYTEDEENLLRLYAQMLVNLRNRISSNEAIRKNEERYRQLTDNMSDFIWTVDRDLQLDYLSPSCNRIFGIEREELREDILGKVFPEESQQRIKAAISTFYKDVEEQNIDPERTFTLDILAQRKNGSPFWLSTNYKALTDKSGAFNGIIGVSYDITERKNAEIALHKSLYEKGERIKELICMYNISHLFGQPNLSVDDYFEKVVAYLPQGFQFPAQTWVRIRTNGNEYRSEPFKETATRLHVSFQVNDVTAGEIEVFQPEKEVFLKEEADLLEGIKSSIEQWIRHTHATQTLITSESRLRGLLESQTHYILRTDIEGRYLYWNKKFEEEFGWIHGNSELYAFNALESIVEEHHSRAKLAVEQCIAEPGKIVQVELNKPGKDNSIKLHFGNLYACRIKRVIQSKCNAQGRISLKEYSNKRKSTG